MRNSRGIKWRWMSIFRIAGFITILSFYPLSLLGADFSLTLKPTAQVDRSPVRLSDIAMIDGPSVLLKETIKNVIVTQSPQPGRTRFVGVDFIRIRLKQAGIDTGSILFSGSEDVSVTRKAAVMPSAKIKQAVEFQIRNHMPWNNEEVSIDGISFDESLMLPTGKLSYKIVPKRNEDYLGRTVLALHLYVDGESVRKIWVNATISVMAEVVTVIRPLGKHQHIEFEDVELKRRDLAKLPSNTVRKIEDVLGNRATMMIYPHTVLQTSMIVSPPLVRRGDMVKIVANTGPMTITATGRIKQQGRKGEMVRVVNTDSNRIITARVVGPGTVVVDF